MVGRPDPAEPVPTLPVRTPGQPTAAHRQGRCPQARPWRPGPRSALCAMSAPPPAPATRGVSSGVRWVDKCMGHVDLGGSRIKDCLISKDLPLVPSAQKRRLGPGAARTRLPRWPLPASVSPPPARPALPFLGLVQRWPRRSERGSQAPGDQGREERCVRACLPAGAVCVAGVTKCGKGPGWPRPCLLLVCRGPQTSYPAPPSRGLPSGKIGMSPSGSPRACGAQPRQMGLLGPWALQGDPIPAWTAQPNPPPGQPPSWPDPSGGWPGLRCPGEAPL